VGGEVGLGLGRVGSGWCDYLLGTMPEFLTSRGLKSNFVTTFDWVDFA
jgi:hypothetical protein